MIIYNNIGYSFTATPHCDNISHKAYSFGKNLKIMGINDITCGDKKGQKN